MKSTEHLTSNRKTTQMILISNITSSLFDPTRVFQSELVWLNKLIDDDPYIRTRILYLDSSEEFHRTMRDTCIILFKKRSSVLQIETGRMMSRMRDRIRFSIRFSINLEYRKA